MNRSLGQALLRGSAALAVADFAKKGMLAVTVVLCARFVPKATFGNYMLLMSFYQIFSVIAGAGLPNVLVRQVARRPQWVPSQAVGSALMRVLCAVPALALMFLVFLLGGYARSLLPALASFSLLIVLRSTTENAIAFFQGREDPAACARISLVQSLATLACTIFVCLTSRDLLALVLCHTVAAACSTVYAIRQFSARGLRLAPGFAGSYGVAKAMIYETGWINGATLVSSAYNRCDVLLLQRLASADAVATYSAPYRVLDLAQIVPSSVMGILLPRLCRAGADATDRLDQNRLLSLLLLAALLLIVVSTLLAPWAVPLLLGKTYVSSVWVAQVLIWATPFMFWNYVLLSHLVASRAERYIFIGAAIALAFNLAANVVLIPRFGYLAAAWNTILTEAMLLAANYVFCVKAQVLVFPAWPARVLFTLAGVFTGAVLWHVWPVQLRVVAAMILLLSPFLMLSPLRAWFSQSEVNVALAQ